jgi:hypothetical protein
MEINNDSLENALSSGNVEKHHADEPKISREQEIGHHQGALTTLINERNELIKMIQNVEVVMQAHIKRLEELGVKIKMQKQ